MLFGYLLCQVYLLYRLPETSQEGIFDIHAEADCDEVAASDTRSSPDRLIAEVHIIHTNTQTTLHGDLRRVRAVILKYQTKTRVFARAAPTIIVRRLVRPNLT